MANVYLNTGTLSLYQSSNGTSWTTMSGSSPYTLAVNKYYKLTATAPASGQIFTEWILTNNVNNIVQLTDKYNDEAIFNTLNQTWSYENDITIQIEANYENEDKEFLNRRGLKDVVNRLKDEDIKINIKNPDDFDIEKNSINLYDKYLIDERGKYILEHPELMLESALPIDFEEPDDNITWATYVEEQGTQAENFPYPGMDDNVLTTWINQLSIKQWKNILNLFLEQFSQGTIDYNSNIILTIDGVDYNFNYIWAVNVNEENPSQFIIDIVLPINSAQGWRAYRFGAQDGKTLKIAWSQTHAENNSTYSDRITYLTTNINTNTFSNSIATWKETIKAFFLIRDWIAATQEYGVSWEEIYNSMGMPKNNPTSNCIWEGKNINWLYDLEYFSNYSVWIPYGLFIIDNKLYYFDKILAINDDDCWHISPYPLNISKNVIIFSDENNNIRKYSLGSDDEDDSNYVKKTGDTMTGNLNIIGGKSLNVGCEYNVTNSELSSLAVGGYQADPNGEIDPHDIPFPVYALGASSIASGFKSIALGNSAVAVGIGAFAGDKGAHAEGYLGDWNAIKVTSYNYANKQYKVMPDENEQFGDIYEGCIVVYADRYYQVRYATVTNVIYDETTGQPTFTTDKNLERNSYNSQALNNSTVYVTLSGAIGQGSHAEGRSALALEYYAHAEGSGARAIGQISHAEGSNTIASGECSHAEGNYTTSSGINSHAEGGMGTSTIILTGAKNATTYTTSDTSFIQIGDTISITSSNSLPSSYSATVTSFVNNTSVTLNKTISSSAISNKTCYVYKKSNVSGESAHGEGGGTTASGKFSHAEGFKTIASGMATHGEGIGTTAQRRSQHTEGEYNILDSSGSITTRGTYLHIAGNGTSSTRSNAHTLDWSGNAWFAGDVYTGSTSGTNKDSGSKKLATEEYVTTSVSGKEDSSNKVTSLSSSSTNTQYPSALCVYQALLQSGIGIITSNTNLWELDEGIYRTNVSTADRTIKLYYNSEDYINIHDGVEAVLFVSKPPNNAAREIMVMTAGGYLYYISANVDDGNSVDIFDEFEILQNKVTSISSSSTDYQYPSAKLLYDQLALKQNTLTQGTNITINGSTISSTDTKNTAGSTDTSSKIYLVGATGQSANPQTYSDNEVYATNGTLTAKEFSLGTNAKIVYNTSESCIEFSFS